MDLWLEETILYLLSLSFFLATAGL